MKTGKEAVLSGAQTPMPRVKENKEICSKCYPHNRWVSQLSSVNPMTTVREDLARVHHLQKVKRILGKAPKAVLPQAGSWVRFYKHRVTRYHLTGSRNEVMLGSML